MVMASQLSGRRQAAGEDGLCGFEQAGQSRRELARGQPLAQLQREGDDDGGKADHGRVEQVVAQPAVEVLGDDDGKQHAEGRNPPGCQWRHAQGEQHTGDHGAAVAEKQRTGRSRSLSMRASKPTANPTARAIWNRMP
jgi:hypothetical protein